MAVVRGSLIVALLLWTGSARQAVAQGLPVPWVNADIGAVGAAGSANAVNGGFTVTGSGVDIWGYSDQFHFAYVELPHDGYLEARVTGIEGPHAWSKAGVMIRRSLAANSIHESFFVTPGNGAVHQRRYETGGRPTTIRSRPGSRVCRCTSASAVKVSSSRCSFRAMA